MVKSIISALMLLILLSCESNSAIKEGKQYVVLQNPVAEAPHVIAFFSFYCGPCYQFARQYPVNDAIEPILPAGEKVIKYHVSVMGKLGNQLTEAWAIAMVMGVNDTVELPLFELMQKTQGPVSPDDIKLIFAHAGVTPEQYQSAQHSLVVKARVAEQDAALQKFSVSGTPSYYVKGRYGVNHSGIIADTPEAYVDSFVQVISYLLKR
jgi:protein dithiol oxidoreductase (disulfide-forming)